MAEESAQQQESQEVSQDEQQAEGADQKPSVVPLEEHKKLRARAQAAEKKLKEFEAAEEERRLAAMSEVDRLKAENKKFSEQIETRRVKDEKAKALRAAIDGIGDGWTVDHALKPADKDSPTLYDLVDDISYDPKTIAAKVKGLVDSVKRQKTASRTPIPGQPTNVQSGPMAQQQSQVSTAELLKMSRENPEAFVAEITRLTTPAARIGFPR